MGEAIREDVTISLANASMIAERDVGPNSHTEEARMAYGTHLIFFRTSKEAKLFISQIVSERLLI